MLVSAILDRIAVFSFVRQRIRHASCAFCLIVFASTFVTAADESTVLVQTLNESNWDALIPHGKEVDAIYGDMVMQNGHLRAVIAKPVVTRNANMTVRNVGGCFAAGTLSSIATSSPRT